MTLTLRSEIIQVFRDRIHKETHFRLSKDELDVLIDGFVEELQGTKTEKQIRALCEAEIKLLEEGYPQPSVAKYVTRYRKAIITAIEDGSLPLTKATSHHYIHQQRVTGVQEERYEHWALTYLKYSPAVFENIDKRSQLTNRDKQLSLRLVPVERYIELLRGFLDRKGQFEARWLATAIAGVTGRRFAEFMANGTFVLTEHPYLLRFEGQLMSRVGHGEGDNIVTLFPAAEVLEAIERLRKLPEVEAIAKLKGATLATALKVFHRKLNSACGKVLIQVVPPMESRKAVSVHNLRSLYGAIAVHFFCHERQVEYDFVQHFLGHVMDSPATGHCFSYALSDDQGGLLRSKGAMLDKVPELPLGVPQKRAESDLDDKPLPLALELEQLLTETEAVEKAEAKPKRGGRRKAQVEVADEAIDESHKVPEALHPETVEAQTTPKDRKRKKQVVETETVQTEAKADTQPVPDTWRSELERRIEQMRAEFEAQIKELRQESNVGWFVRRVEALERENLALRLERDRAMAAVQKTDAVEIERLKKENEVIALELKQAQDKLDSFRRLLNGGNAGATAAESGVAKAQQEKAEVLALVEPKPTAAQAEGTRAIVSQSAGGDKAKAEAKTEAATGLRRGPKGGKAFQRAEAIFLAIKDWNHQNELWEYHQEIGVESPRWHNRGKATEGLKDFVRQQMSL